MGETVVVLKQGEGRTLASGGLWVYDNEIESIHGRFKNGGIVSVYGQNDYPLGKGYINQNSKIRVRLLTRNVDEEISGDLFRRRLQTAWEYRKTVMGGLNSPDLNSCRLVFGDADFLPGLVIDKFSDVLVLQSTTLGMDALKNEIVDILKQILLQDGIEIRGVYERSDSNERHKEGIPVINDFIGEPFDTKVPILENGVKYLVDIADGQKTGFFLDQKYNRLAMQKFCKGKRVLDCFTHTGSFALNAGFAGAEDVLAVDASAIALRQAEDNAKLNNLENIVHFTQEDVFEMLPELEKSGKKFDVVILDPPAFTKSKETIKRAEKGYREINTRGLNLVKNGGILATCSCSHYMNYENFTKVIKQAAKNANKQLRQIEFRTQGPDHPILWSAEESYYLKFYIFQVLDR